MTKARTLADNFAADINQVNAGVGITGGGTSGTVTITNDMATTIAAKGDLVAGTANDAYAALTVGANDTVLTADSSTATGLKWATVSAGGMTQLASGTLPTGASTITLSSISGSYNNLQLVLIDVSNSANEQNIAIRFNNDTSLLYFHQSSTVETTNAMTNDNIQIALDPFTNTRNSHTVVDIPNYANTSAIKTTQTLSFYATSATVRTVKINKGVYRSTTAINSITIYDRNAFNFSTGSYILYGVK